MSNKKIPSLESIHTFLNATNASIDKYLSGQENTVAKSITKALADSLILENQQVEGEPSEAYLGFLDTHIPHLIDSLAYTASIEGGLNGIMERQNEENNPDEEDFSKYANVIPMSKYSH